MEESRFCRECVATYMKSYYKAHKEKIREATRRWRRNNIEKHRENRRRGNKKWYKTSKGIEAKRKVKRQNEKWGGASSKITSFGIDVFQNALEQHHVINNHI